MKYKDWLTPENLILVEGWARDGLTLDEIGSKMGVARSSVYKWKSENKDFSDAIKRGREVADYEVENALFKRARGFEYEETITEIYGEGENARKHIKRVKKYMPPDTGAAAFWLKNRRPDRWRDRPALDDMGDDKLQAYLDKLESEIHVEP